MFLRHLIHILFPSYCVVCNHAGALIHRHCLSRPTSAPPPIHTKIHACFSYKDPRVKKLVRHLKSREDRELASTLSKALYIQWTQNNAAANAQDIIATCVPPRRDRMKKYGFNQAALLTKAFSKQSSGITYIPDLFIRTRETSKQALIQNRNQRLQNLKNVFILNNKYRECLSNAFVVIIDDVSTTGATISELQTCLGTTQSLGLVLAH